MPAEGRDGAYVGSGHGTVTGDRVVGTIAWSLYAGDCLYPRIRRREAVPDDLHLCTLNPGGVIKTPDGAHIQFDGRGYGLRSGKWYRLSATLTFATDAVEHQWLTEVLAVMEGDFDEKAGRAIWRVYVPNSLFVSSTGDRIPLVGMQHYDLIVIGGGAGGFGAAIKANDLGARTALVNTGLPLGGTCVSVGCVPSKALLWAAEVLHTSRHHGIPGLELEVKHIDVAAIVNDEVALVERMRRDKYAAVLRELEHVTLIEGSARFSTPKTIEVNSHTLASERFVIATGSTATVPPIEGLREAGFMTHIEALRRERLPQSVVVIGAGPLGLEFAHLFSRFGVRVTILQRPPTIFPHTEAILARRLTEILEREGIRVVTGVQVKSVARSGTSKRVTYETAGAARTVDIEEILLVAGKTANTAGLQLSTAGVVVDLREAIKVNRFLRTSAAHVYAA